jgi:hypothetical protein
VIQADLTQVTDSSRLDKIHELEVEFKDCKLLIAEKMKLESHQPNNYHEQVGVFLNTVRLLSRETNHFQQRINRALEHHHSNNHNHSFPPSSVEKRKTPPE